MKEHNLMKEDNVLSEEEDQEAKRIQQQIEEGLGFQKTDVEKLFKFDLLNNLGEMETNQDFYSNQRVATIQQLRKD